MRVKEIITSKERIDPDTIRGLTTLSNKDVETTLVMDVVKNTNAIFEDMYVFENACLVLNEITPDITKIEGLLPQHIWKAVDIIKRLRSSAEFSHEVLMYIKYIFNDAGMWFYPENIGLDNDILDNVKAKALEGPFPLEEEHLGIQAYKYLTIQEYINN